MMITAIEAVRQVKMVRMSWTINKRKAPFVPIWVEERRRFQKQSDGGARPSGKLLWDSNGLLVSVLPLSISLVEQGFTLNRAYRKVPTETGPGQLMLIWDMPGTEYTPEQQEENRRVELTDEQRLELIGCLLASQNAIGSWSEQVKIMFNPPVGRVPAHLYISLIAPKAGDVELGPSLDLTEGGDFVLC